MWRDSDLSGPIAVLCKAHGIDGREVMETLCQDTRLNISSAYREPGFAFGGSCPRKDLRALLHRAKEGDIECPLLGAILASNERHIQRGMDLIAETGRRKAWHPGLELQAWNRWRARESGCEFGGETHWQGG
jgi:GDP-mannose 6-dehydrogenase